MRVSTSWRGNAATVRAPLGILLMAYGSPDSPTDLEAYYTEIRRGRPPTAEQLQELAARYARIGGVSTLNAITTAQAAGLQSKLDPSRREFRVYVGMKHWQPRISVAVAAMAADGIQEAIGVVLAPHFSRLSVGEYHARVHEAVSGLLDAPRFDLVRDWHVQPLLIDAFARRVDIGLARFTKAERPRVHVVFTAHNLPRRILAEGDPYPEQVAETARLIAARLGLNSWSVAWQSAGRTPEPWLEPDVKQAIAARDACLVCPVGFVSDHLETLHDLDIDLRDHAARLGTHVERTDSFNADADFIDVLDQIALLHFDAAVRR
jgi:protoporphyrin/coproporphyrin ferrochelatase